MQRMFNFNVLYIVIRNEHYNNSLTINILGNWLPTFLLFGFLGLVGLLQFLITFTTILYSCRVLVCPTKRNPIVCNCNSESFARGNVIVLNNNLVTRISVHARLFHFDQTSTLHALIRACALIYFSGSFKDFCQIFRPNPENLWQKLGLFFW